MPPDASYRTSPPPWLVDWMRDASRHGQCHSLVLGTTGRTDLDRVARALAEYLNEFDSDGGCQWRAFGTELLRHLAGNPASRDLVLAASGPRGALDPARPDLDRVARRLARLGGVVLASPAGLSATSDLDEIYRVCLSAGEPADLRNFHLWLNPGRYSFQSLVSVIADSFLDWSCHALPPLPGRLDTLRRSSGPSLPS